LSFKSKSGGNICGLAFSPNGKRLALINQKYTIEVWDVSNLKDSAQTK
jgi:WD40 repeat protein